MGWDWKGMCRDDSRARILARRQWYEDNYLFNWFMSLSWSLCCWILRPMKYISSSFMTTRDQVQFNFTTKMVGSSPLVIDWSAHHRPLTALLSPAHVVTLPLFYTALKYYNIPVLINFSLKSPFHESLHCVTDPSPSPRYLINSLNIIPSSNYTHIHEHLPASMVCVPTPP